VIGEDIVEFKGEVEVLGSSVITEPLSVDGPEGTVDISIDIGVSGVGIVQSDVERDSNVNARSVPIPRREGSSAVDCIRGKRESRLEGRLSGNGIEVGVDDVSIIGNVPFEVWMAVGRIASYCGRYSGSTFACMSAWPDISGNSLESDRVCINSYDTAGQE